MTQPATFRLTREQLREAKRREDTARACRIKRVYSNKRAAKRAAAEFRGPNSVKPYHCPACGKFHLTSVRERSAE